MKDNPYRCLVVDDDDALRTAVVKALERAEYSPLGSHSAEDALELLEAHPGIEVILSDIHMDGADGVALLEQVRTKYPETAMIMLTAISDIDVAVKCLQLGAFDYLAKPFQLEELSARVEKSLERRRLVIENRRYHDHLAELVREQARRIESVYLEAIQSLVHALEAKDEYTYGHSARVSEYSRWIASDMGLDAGQMALLDLGAELHDAGKIGIKESILLKPARLTEEEYEHIKTHPVIGERILRPLLGDAPAILQVVRSHHERVDGGGFPDGLIGDEIPLLVRIVTVADTFDAMTTGRPYRPGLSAERAFEEFERCKGTQFDPDVVDSFLSAAVSRSFPIKTPEKIKHFLPETLSPQPIPQPPS